MEFPLLVMRAPTISKNYFYRNGANGMTLAGNSQPQVRENIFQQTGFGINIAQNASPVVVGNQIQNNRSGVIVQANARPILRNNLIQGSKEDGLVVIAQAIPDLGNASQPGGNEFRNNARYDINASAAKQIISASWQYLCSNRIAGKVDFNPQTTSVTNNSQTAALPNSTIPKIPANQEISFSALTQSIPLTIQQSTIISHQSSVISQQSTANCSLCSQPLYHWRHLHIINNHPPQEWKGWAAFLFLAAWQLEKHRPKFKFPQRQKSLHCQQLSLIQHN